MDEQIVAETDERSHVAELLRLRGLLLALHGDLADGTARLWEAVEWARSRSAKLFELRALRDLARLWRDQGKPQQARELLAPVYDWFTEGFDTRYLKDAKALLEELS